MIRAVKRGQSAADNVCNLTFLRVQRPDHPPAQTGAVRDDLAPETWMTPSVLQISLS